MLIADKSARTIKKKSAPGIRLKKLRPPEYIKQYRITGKKSTRFYFKVIY